MLPGSPTLTRTCVVACAVAALFAIPSLAAAQHYDASGGFSASANPNGAWSYGSESALGGTFTAFGNYQDFGSYDMWNTGQYYPNGAAVAHNETNQTQSFQTVELPPDYLNIDPQGGTSVVRFTAQNGGTFDVAGNFMHTDYANPGTNAYVIVNGNTTSPLFQHFICAGSTSCNGTYDFSFTQALNSGDTIDFLVANAGHGDAYLGTGLTATIDRSDAVNAAPEPSSLVLLGTGLVGLVPMARRRRR